MPGTMDPPGCPVGTVQANGRIPMANGRGGWSHRLPPWSPGQTPPPDPIRPVSRHDARRRV